MRRSICCCDPNIAIAGEKATWKFIYTPSTDLLKQSKLLFDLNSEGRDFDWEMPQNSLKKKANLIWAQIGSDKPIEAKIITVKETNSQKFEFELPRNMQAGENFIISIGNPDNNEKKGNLCQSFVQRKRLFNLTIIPKGKKETEEEVFHLDVKGNKLYNIKIITPSYVSRNKRFDVIVRFEDKFGNLTNNAPEKTLIELSYEHLRENLNWKLFIPETGFIALPNLYFNEPGIYKIQLKNLENDSIFFSPPIKCFADSDISMFWGLLHGESQRFDASDNIENCLRHFRDDSAFQYYATSPFDGDKETTTDLWKNITHHLAEFNEDERFVTFLSFQWKGTPQEEGVRQFVYSKDNKQIFRKKDLKSNSLKKIYKLYSPKDLISIPTFTMGKESLFDFKDYNYDFERVVEIYNAWGSSESTPKDGNLRPIKGSKKTSDGMAEGAVLKALMHNCRFGFVAGGLDDRGIYSDYYNTDQVQYSPGLTAIIAKTHSRDSLFDALYNRSCYATTGARMIIGLNVANEPMGKELNTTSKPGLVFNRYISGYAIGTELLEEVLIYRNNQLLRKFTPKEMIFDFDFDDTEILSNIAIDAKDGKPPFVFYYIKAIQKDGEIAWGSPIWVDCSTNNLPKTNGKKVKKKID